MKWDIFSRRKREGEMTVQERIDRLAKSIDKFAPRRYQSQRALFYYNYKIGAAYLIPLLELLNILADRRRLKEDREGFSRDLFDKLKNFYDPRDRLSSDEAVANRNLQKKYRELLLYFYGKSDFLPPPHELGDGEGPG
jgi:hypothetical protein